MDRFLQDLRHAARSLFRRPWLTVVAVSILAVGVGSATFVASAVDTVFQAAMPYPDPDTLIDVRCSYREAEGSTRSMAPADFLAFERVLERGPGQGRAEGGGAFEALGAYVPFGQGDLVTPEGGASRLAVRQVSDGLLEALAIRADAGRLFLAEDYREGAPPVVLVSHRLWQSRFGADPGVVGETILLDGEERVVRGVLPERFRIPGGEADAVLPLRWSAADADDRSSAYLGAIGRLRPGASLEQVRAALDGVAGRLEEEHPESNDGVGAHAAPLHEMFTAQARRPLVFLAGAAFLLLLVAGLNLSGLQVVRTVDRRRELAVRLALGAARRRLIGGLLFDGGLVGAGGWVLGLGMARSALGALPRLQGVYVPSGFEVGLSPAVVAFAGLVAAAAALLPTLAAARALPEPSAVAPGVTWGWPGRPGARPGKGGPSGWLPVAQVALTSAVLVSAGLLLRSSLALGAVEPGEAPERVVTFELSLPESRYGDDGAPEAFFDRLSERLAGRPDVVAVAAAHALPPEGGWSYAPEVEGRELPEEVSLDWQVIAGDYFSALGVPVLRGRGFVPGDRAGTRPVMVIDEGAARRLFGEDDPLGSRVRFNERWHEVVGVVATQPSVDPWDQPTVYVAHAQSPVPGSFLRNLEVAVRVRGGAEDLLAAVDREVAAVDPLLAAASVQTLDRRMASGLQRLRGRYHAVLAGVLGTLSLLLAAVGVFAVQAFQVRRRTREIGIRMAVGARIAQVVRLVLGRGLKIAAAGTVLGLLTSLALSNVLEQILFGVEPADPLTLAAVAGLLAVTVLAASVVPAARAARIDPMETLRSE